MRESTLQTTCLSALKLEGYYVLNLHGSAFASRGAPDVVACINEQFIAFEFKVGGNDLEPAQRIHKKRIENNGGKHYVIRSLKDLEDALDLIRR